MNKFAFPPKAWYNTVEYNTLTKEREKYNE